MAWSLTGRRSERSLGSVPLPIRILLGLALLAQLATHGLVMRRDIQIRDLPAVPASGMIEVMALGERAALSRAMMLWLQGFDYQPGISVPFARLDYDRLTDWLGTILHLDPRGHYPLLSAARIYSEVPDPVRKRKVLDFVQQAYRADPATRWPWLAHAVFVAKHRLRDRDLALEYARELRLDGARSGAPEWARQMELFVLADFGDTEAAKILLGGLIESGEITEPAEIDFLTRRLDAAPESVTAPE